MMVLLQAQCRRWFTFHFLHKSLADESQEQGPLRDPLCAISHITTCAHVQIHTCMDAQTCTCSSLYGTSANLYCSPLHLSMSNLRSIDPPLRLHSFSQNRCQPSITHTDVFNKKAMKKKIRRRWRRNKKGQSSHAGETWR